MTPLSTHNILIKGAIAVLATAMLITAQVQSPLSSAFVFPAGYASYNVRDGYRKYDGRDDYERVPLDNMLIFGASAGKRFALKSTPRLRIQALAEIGWGKAENDVFEAEYTDGVIRKTYEYLNLMTIGAQTDLQALFPSSSNKKQTYFLSIGPGAHRTSIHYTTKAAGGRESDPGDKTQTLSFSANIGAGTEYQWNSQRAVSVAYNLRIWNPVGYTEYGQLFPMGAEYQELFVSHTLQVQILLPRSRYAGF